MNIKTGLCTRKMLPISFLFLFLDDFEHLCVCVLNGWLISIYVQVVKSEGLNMSNTSKICLFLNSLDLSYSGKVFFDTNCRLILPVCIFVLIKNIPIIVSHTALLVLVDWTLFRKGCK